MLKILTPEISRARSVQSSAHMLSLGFFQILLCWRRKEYSQRVNPNKGKLYELLIQRILIIIKYAVINISESITQGLLIIGIFSLLKQREL